jgi:hypothetical protein
MRKISAMFMAFFGLAATAEETQQIDPATILFSTPTLNDSLPSEFLAESAVSGACIRTHEDNWRQFEFVSKKFQLQIDEELAAIDSIWRDHSKPIGEFHGFSDTHIRSAIPSPLGIEFRSKSWRES